MTKRLCLVSLLAALCASEMGERVASAGAWTQDPGHFYVTLGYTYFFANESVDDMGMAQKLQILETKPQLQQVDARYTDQTLALYGEVGLWPRHLNLTFYVPLYKSLQLSALDDTGSYSDSGVGDSLVALKYKFYDCKFVVTGQVEVGVPSGDALKTNIPTGDNEWSYEGRLLLAKDLYPVPVFIDAEIGYRKRTSGTALEHGLGTTEVKINYSDDIPFLVQAGLKLSPHRWWTKSVLILATFAGVVSTRNADKSLVDPISGVSATANNQSFMAVGGGLSWNPWAGLLLNFDSRIFLWGENTGKGYSFTGSLGYAL